MKFKKIGDGRRSLAMGELAMSAAPELEECREHDILQAPEEKKPKLRRSLGGKVEKRTGNKVNKWSLLDVFGWGSKKTKTRKSEGTAMTLDDAIYPVGVNDENKVSKIPQKDVNTTTKTVDRAIGDRVPIVPLKAGKGNAYKNRILTENNVKGTNSSKCKESRYTPMQHVAGIPSCSERKRRSHRFSLDTILSRSETKGVRVSPLRNAKKNSVGELPSARYTDKTNTPGITQEMVSARKQSLRQTPVSMINKATPDEPSSARTTALERRPPVKKNSHPLRGAATSTVTPVRTPIKPGSRTNSIASKTCTYQAPTLSSMRKCTPRSCNKSYGSSGAAFAPDMTLKYFDEDSVNDRSVDAKTDKTASEIVGSNMNYKQEIVPLTMEELNALDIATLLPPVCRNDTHVVPDKQEGQSSDITTPQEHCSDDEKLKKGKSLEAPVLKAGVGQSENSRESLASSLTRGIKSISLRSLGQRKSTSSLQGAEQSTPVARTRTAVKRSHSVAVASNVSNLLCPPSPMLTPMSSVAKELQEMKSKKRRKEPTLEEIIKDKRRSRTKEAAAAKKPPPKPPRKSLKSRLSSSRLRRKSTLWNSPEGKQHPLPPTTGTTKMDTENKPSKEDNKVKRKSSFREMLSSASKLPPPPKPARRSLSTPKKDSETSSIHDITASSSFSSSAAKPPLSFGEGVRKLRRKLSRASDMRANEIQAEREERRNSVQMPVFNAGHTPKPPRGRRDERLV